MPRAFDCISHELLIEKLYAYRSCKCALNLINDYFSCRQQRTKVRERFSTWREIMFGVPQGPILGPLLFNIYLNDLYLLSEEFDMANYIDDCSPYESSVSVEDVIFKLENDARLLMEWYTNNYLSPNPDKWHLLLSDKDNELFVTIGQKSICNSSNEKILGVVFDNILNFNCHLDKLCKKADQKIHALARVSSFMSHKQRKIIMNAFISSQFNYCPLL